MPDKITKEILIRNIRNEITEKIQNRFTGTMTFTVNMRDGGVGNVEIMVKANLRNPDLELKKPRYIRRDHLN